MLSISISDFTCKGSAAFNLCLCALAHLQRKPSRWMLSPSSQLVVHYWLLSEFSFSLQCILESSRVSINREGSNESRRPSKTVPQRMAPASLRAASKCSFYCGCRTGFMVWPEQQHRTTLSEGSWFEYSDAAVTKVLIFFSTSPPAFSLYSRLCKLCSQSCVSDLI